MALVYETNHTWREVEAAFFFRIQFIFEVGAVLQMVALSNGIFSPLSVTIASPNLCSSYKQCHLKFSSFIHGVGLQNSEVLCRLRIKSGEIRSSSSFFFFSFFFLVLFGCLINLFVYT